MNLSNPQLMGSENGKFYVVGMDPKNTKVVMPITRKKAVEMFGPIPSQRANLAPQTGGPYIQGEGAYLIGAKGRGAFVIGGRGTTLPADVGAAPGNTTLQPIASDSTSIPEPETYGAGPLDWQEIDRIKAYLRAVGPIPANMLKNTGAGPMSDARRKALDMRRVEHAEHEMQQQIARRQAVTGAGPREDFRDARVMEQKAKMVYEQLRKRRDRKVNPDPYRSDEELWNIASRMEGGSAVEAGAMAVNTLSNVIGNNITASEARRRAKDLRVMEAKASTFYRQMQKRRDRKKNPDPWRSDEELWEIAQATITR